MSALNIFPVSYKVRDQRIIIVGGGDEALNKARLAVKTAAEIVVIAQEFTADFSDLEVTRIERAFDDNDLTDTALVFVADDGPDGDAAKLSARARNIPLNVVDRPDECDFFTPAIVDRAPVSIAISSEGDAPVLSRLIRAKIEVSLSPNLGAIAHLAGRFRKRVEALLSDGADRRRFYEKLVASPDIEAAVTEGSARAERAAEELLSQHASGEEDGGSVWLIGAGPGAQDLLTLRAQRLLQQADVIVHDQLVPELVVQMGRRDAERVPVGKAKGHHSFSQAKINALLIRLARQGKKVARLKSGDPMIFGRAGEEISALKKAGVSFSIVPGVTSALAAAADSATPVTLRKVSSGFVVATAHGADDAELSHWAALAAQGVTIGIYMGKSVAGAVSAKLIANNMSGETPVGVVVNAGRADRSLYTGQLHDLRNDDPWLADGPAIIFIGDAVSHGEWTDAVSLAEQHIKVA
jgi:uroporphyrin-III C-methyltransferase/precorrin-2 dehydrogenase/sirohydrochlorin ferrochelatase